MDIPCANNFDVLRKCTEILPFTIYVFDFNDNKFIYINRNFEEIIGYPIAEAEKKRSPLRNASFR
jgi:PAS domain-containing protein